MNKDITKDEIMAEQKPGFHHRIYPYMDEMVQYATDREGADPWIVRDRSTALRNERTGRGKALVRVWVASDWERVAVEGTP